MRSRPDGSRLKRTGGLAFTAGATAFIVTTLDFLWPGVLKYRPIAEMLGVVGIAGIMLGPLIWLAGHIIFASSFLPGRDD